MSIEDETPTLPVGVLLSRILLHLCRSRPFTDGTRGVSTKFRDGLSTPLPQTPLLPPTCRMLLTLPSGHDTFRMARLCLRLSPLSNLYPLSQLERASGCMVTSLAAAQAREKSLTSREPREPSLPCRGACACCDVLGNDLSREAGGYHAHGSLRSPVERAGRDQEHRAGLTERKETSDATASDHDP